MHDLPDLDILFLGGVLPRHTDGSPVDLTRYGAPDSAADAFQWNMINGIERNTGHPMTIVSAPFVSARSRALRERFVPGFRWQHADAKRDKCVGFVNFLGLRNVSREVTVRRPLESWLKGSASTRGARQVVIAYSMHGPFLQQFSLIKRRNPAAIICLVVPDLPEHMRDMSETGPVVSWLKKIDMSRNRKALGYVDRFVLVSTHQAGPLGIGPDRHIVIEGMVESDAQPVSEPAPLMDGGSRMFTIVYTGGLNRRYGVLDLVDSLKHLDREDVRLILCGRGDSEDCIRDRASREQRIVYLGNVSRGEAVAWQRAGDLLVNPRPSSGEFTKYSFPSKTLEYLNAGKPVLIYPNDGIPPEYREYVLSIPEPGPRGIAQAIKNVMELPDQERETLGRRSREFVSREKSSGRQMQRLLDFVRSVP